VIEVTSTQDHSDHLGRHYIVEHTMRAISLLNIVPIAGGLGGCTNGAAMENPLQEPEIIVGNPTTQANAKPPWVRIRNLSWAGSGCPAGTVAENLAPDLQAFTLLFDSFVAELGPGLPLSLSRRNCQILVDLDFPPGWSFSVVDVDHGGFASLETGVSGVQQSSYYFQGESRTARLQTTLNGPWVGDYQVRESLAPDALVWSPCAARRPLIINLQVRVINNSRNPNARGVMTTGSMNGPVMYIYRLQWRRCPA
jgi:hypothetical protein